MEPDNNRPAGTRGATGVAQPTEAVMCAPHLTASSRLRGEERSAKRQRLPAARRSIRKIDRPRFRAGPET